MLHSVGRIPLANYLRCCTSSSTGHLRKVPRAGGSLGSSPLGLHTPSVDCCSFSASSPLLLHHPLPSPPASPQHQPSPHHPLASSTQVRSCSNHSKAPPQSGQATMAANSSGTEPKFTNRLKQEKSPYLLQHAHNPVEWYPWGEEAIQRARAENKLIFLSVGYSTCHWCHVMEKESFENEEVAKIMNEHFINIKVDREERPDIDKLYMMFILLINGSGGWPMSVWLTPDLAPVTGGTYFPPNDRWGMPGFTTVLTKLASKWSTDKDDLVTTGRSVIEAIRRNVDHKRADEVEDATNMETLEAKFRQAVNMYQRNYDMVWGGSLGAPKFPEASKLNLMFHLHVQEPKHKVLGVVLNTLDKMAAGGIHDHVFGGFARYSVDKKWHVPHFEKMLYDQGQLLSLYANGYRLTKKPSYLAVADAIYRYLCKDLRHPAGGFYSGEDADSLPTAESEEKIEGAFYAWTYDEVKELLGANGEKFGELGGVDPVAVYAAHYDVKEEGNVKPSSDPHGHLLGKNILIVYGSVRETAEKFNTTVEIVERILKTGNELLHEVRDKRPRPHLDTKILCAWNGLVLSGLSQLACVKDAPGRSEYLATAEALVKFIRANLYDVQARKLLRSCYGGAEESLASERPIYGFIDDYAFLIKGLIDYYVASLDEHALHWAKELQDIQDELFWDTKHGAYFYSEANSPNVAVRLKEDHDGAEPCGNSVAAHNLLLLSDYFEEERLKEKARTLFDYFAHTAHFGYVLPEMMSAALLEEQGRNTLIVVGPESPEATALVDGVREFYIPGMIIVQLKIDQPAHIVRRRKSLDNFKMVKNMPTAYICHNKVCHLPVTEPERLTEEFQPRYTFHYQEYEN
ncbi:spermatogenesis-associated protein 20 isoform X1 [Anopheles merus]|uniref:spermatogenesis-associated protein 20 isoform X1 n=2 Tax=Anopheles merus TaxID=30066 RepID=UPI001BE41C24|nr:spermatogenesis-associated protein 20 isoform X1 [Anopheles merus]XP_041780473.1 spermatogenesis-associated protein 20 isoform X1 [Anopheles merus]